MNLERGWGAQSKIRPPQKKEERPRQGKARRGEATQTTRQEDNHNYNHNHNTTIRQDKTTHDKLKTRQSQDNRATGQLQDSGKATTTRRDKRCVGFVCITRLLKDEQGAYARWSLRRKRQTLRMRIIWQKKSLLPRPFDHDHP
jgi:hypothetical protein